MAAHFPQHGLTPGGGEEKKCTDYPPSYADGLGFVFSLAGTSLRMKVYETLALLFLGGCSLVQQ